MEHFLINSSVCLFVLWIFYKLVLENTSWHRFKRWYLLGSIVIAIAIPFVVVKTVVIPIESSPIVDFANSPVVTEIMEPQKQPFNWTSILISIYVLGVVVMLWRFIRNLRSFQINEEDEVKSYDNYALVLRQVMTVPHSFIKRIFISKDQYVKQLIPEVVLEHEKAHLDQKHSMDILLIELLLIVFWFNPLLYLIRDSIKLNHEFLADQAVLQSGIQTSQYQETLLSYTQNSHSTALANTFNFPIIKKRFHIMKTKTCSTSLILRTIALIPLVTLLVISCGKKETEFQEIENVINDKSKFNLPQQIVSLIDTKIDSNKTFLVNDVEYEATQVIKVLEEFPLASINFGIRYNEKSIVDINTEKTSTIEDLKNALTAINKHIKDRMKEYRENKEDLPPPPPPAFSEVDKYNRWAREINAQNKLAEESGNNEYAIVKLKDIKRFEVIYNALNDAQKKNAAPWPNFPPPPPPVKIAKQTASVKNGSWEDVEDYLNKKTKPQRRMIGDAIQVINLNRATLQAQYDGKNIHLDVAKKILVEHGQNGVYLDTINNQPTMVIQSKYFYVGPQLINASGDGC